MLTLQAFLLLWFTLVCKTFSKALFFEIAPNQESCVFDIWNTNDTIEFYHQIKDNVFEAAVGITIYNPKNEILFQNAFYESDKINSFAPMQGEYRLCFEHLTNEKMMEIEARMDRDRDRIENIGNKRNRNGNNRNENDDRHERERQKRLARQRRKFEKRQLNKNLDKPIIIGIDMLGGKSDSAYHSDISALMHYEHLKPLMMGVTHIGTNMDEIESIQSIYRNNEETFWLSLFYNQEKMEFFKWIQAWLLIILSIVQIRLIRNWFNKAGYKTDDKNDSKWLFSSVKQGMSTIGFKLSSDDNKRANGGASQMPKYRI